MAAPVPPTADPAGDSTTDPATGARVRISRQSLQVLVGVVVVLVVLALLSGFLQRRHVDHDRRVAVPLDGRRAAVVEIDSGADRINVSTADLGSDLAVVTTPNGAAIHPRAHLVGDRLHVSTGNDQDGDNGYAGGDSRDLGSGAPVEIDVRIARGVRWDVVVEQGAKQISLGLGSGQVHSVELAGGADHADITLPKPTGPDAVHVRAGLSSASFHLPAAVPVQLTFSSGAGSAVVDGQTHQGIGSGTSITGLQPVTGAQPRWIFDIVAGVGTVSLDRQAP